MILCIYYLPPPCVSYFVDPQLYCRAELDLFELNHEIYYVVDDAMFHSIGDTPNTLLSSKHVRNNAFKPSF